MTDEKSPNEIKDIFENDTGELCLTTRREARRTVFRLLFEAEFQKPDDPDAFLADETENLGLRGPEYGYVKEIFDGVFAEKEKIDALIVKFSRGRSIDRLPRVTLTALRIAIYEMGFYAGRDGEHVPLEIAINEAVEICKLFGDEKSPSYANGVLNSAAAELGLKK
ncbi:MAG: transcription antitermination factor NusB [Clostridia bacterium]|nr:transcription antitermination factor NusB [Clostridia bacterium]